MAFLRAQHPASTAQWVASLTGINATTIDKWLSGRSAPGFAHFGALIAAYGPELLAAAFERAPDWLSEAAQAEKRARLQDQQARIAAEMRALDAMAADGIGADGREGSR
ncbi:hypothetical protein L0F51_04080 [Afifella sp. H1R]|uniref:hypothetical protein n=1 Tax=Afifella sp. H1R TaxID=2908841 RepID=UPI001F317F0F|nr:hypothetical protein [Afifella sp. H1R]MCF1502943.1 hypothetical protein [Afifella sp. H1R]